MPFRGFLRANPRARRFASGCPAVPPARKPIPSPSCSRSAWSDLKQSFKAQVFATDIDSRAIARRAPASTRPTLPPTSRRSDWRDFSSQSRGGAYRVHKGIRDMVVFSEQDVIKDPPFSRLDLISCRNLLIYMDGELQKKLIPLFHYALNPGGSLFLGSAETVGDFDDLFESQDRKAKLYRRKQSVLGAYRAALGLPLMPRQEAGGPPSRPAKAPGAEKGPLRELTERTLLQQSPRVAALVDEHGGILYIHGRSGRYLEPAPARPARTS